MRRRWFVLAVALVVAALVGRAVSAGDRSGRKPLAAPTSRPGTSRPAPSSGVISNGPGGVVVSYNAAADYVAKPSTKVGGTLRLLAAGDCGSWDPGRVSSGWCVNMQRLINRTLIGYAEVNGPGYELAPDLATGLGRHNRDYTRWTYTLKSQLRYSDGSPITPSDVKYGIDRLPADSAVRRDVESVTTTGDAITFRLARPFSDFDYLMAMPASAPVPVDGHWLASGPFELRSHRPGRSVVFVRNPHWRQSTDGIRQPLVNSVVLTVIPTLAAIDERLRAGDADARADGGVQPAFGSQIRRNPRLHANADDPVLPATHYLAVTSSVIPNIHCRRAIFYAIDKAAAVQVFGGATGAVPARSLTPPGIDGYDPAFDPYPPGRRLRGDDARARQELRLCGRPNGFKTRFAYGVPSETGPALFRAQRSALARVGIEITSGPELPATFNCTNASAPILRTEGVGLVSTTLAPAYPSGYGLYRPDRSRVPCLENEDTNLESMNDPGIDRVLHAAVRVRTGRVGWQALDRAVMAHATYLPLAYARALYYRNPRLTNVTCDNALANGIYDFVNVGVR